MASHEHREAGRVAAADLQAVEGGQRLLDRRAHLYCRPGAGGTDQVPHAPRCGQTVPFHGPEGVLQLEDRSVGVLEGNDDAVRVVELGLGPVDPIADRRAHRSRTDRQVLVPHEQGHPIAGPQQVVELAKCRCRDAGRVDEVAASVEPLLDRFEAPQHLPGREQAPSAGPPHEGDDAAHIQKATGAPRRPRCGE